MNKNHVKFGALIVVIIGTLFWLAAGGVSETATYYKTIPEIGQLSQQAREKRLRVGGNVAQHSIVRNGREVRFVLAENEQKLSVLYNGNDPLPDTFRDGALALADGKLGSDGVFVANKIQAKCASKYEAKIGEKAPVKRTAL